MHTGQRLVRAKGALTLHQVRSLTHCSLPQHIPKTHVWPTSLNTLLIALGWFATYRLICVFMSSQAPELHCISVWHIHLFTYLSHPSCIIHISIHLSSESTSIQGLP